MAWTGTDNKLTLDKINVSLRLSSAVGNVSRSRRGQMIMSIVSDLQDAPTLLRAVMLQRMDN